ncbi:MAG: hypothetical protein JNG85_03730 [Spirochaetaceae bacterium]|nr:hypothetical protein [Spirochaetaceae bacterium]
MFSLILLGACGIDSYSYYYPPSVANSGDNNLYLTHSTNNSDAAFLGYEIYYRVFEDKAKADGIASAIYSAANSSSTAPSVLQNQLTSGTFPSYYGYAFNPIREPSAAYPLPLLKVGDGSNFRVALSAEGDWTLYINNASVGSPVKRASGKTFYDSSPGATWSGTDVDYSGSTVASSTTLYLVAFGIAYGFDIGTIKTTTSMPAVFPNGTTYTAIPISAH